MTSRQITASHLLNLDSQALGLSSQPLVRTSCQKDGNSKTNCNDNNADISGAEILGVGGAWRATAGEVKGAIRYGHTERRVGGWGLLRAV